MARATMFWILVSCSGEKSFAILPGVCERRISSVDPESCEGVDELAEAGFSVFVKDPDIGCCLLFLEDSGREGPRFETAT